jgi:ATP-dependent RNA helicase DeaD
LDPRLLKSLAALGYEEPTPIQCQAIPPLLEGRDLIGQAATGTGKTAAFSLPLLQRISTLKKSGRPAALILVPTRELAMQVSEAVHRYGRPFGTSVLPVYGGQSFGPQLRALERGVDVVVATPGRALDHVRRQTLALGGVSVVVLDEADEMLDMGFSEDIEAILAETPAERQTMLFSVTLPSRILAIARRHLRNPVEIKVARERMATGEAPRVRQSAYVVSRSNKILAIARLLDMESPASALVFCRTRIEVDELTEKLGARGYRAEPLHGGMAQEARDRAMRKLRAGKADLIVATDVAARGLDIEQLSHVFNYDVPSATESYVHRTGRVGRAGRGGVAITLAEPRELSLLRNIERATGQRIQIVAIPTTADLQAKRLGLTRASLKETLLAGDLEEFRGVVESLSLEHDLFDVALAAVKVAHKAGGNAVEDAEEIPVPLSSEGRPAERRGPPARTGTGRRDAGRDARGAGARKPAGPARDMVRLTVDLGSESGIRPQDLIGAITSQGGLPARAIGTIAVSYRRSTVEVAADLAAEAMAALRRSTIKGKKPAVRPDRRQ